MKPDTLKLGCLAGAAFFKAASGNRAELDAQSYKGVNISECRGQAGNEKASETAVAVLTILSRRTCSPSTVDGSSSRHPDILPCP